MGYAVLYMHILKHDCICLVYYLFMHNYMRNKVNQSKFAAMPAYCPRYTLNITLHSIFLLTLNCQLINAFSMLSWILDSTSKTQDLNLPCQLRPTLPSLRSKSNVQFSCKCLHRLLQFSLYGSQYCDYALAIFIPTQAHLLLHLLLTLLLLIIILTTLLDLLILVIIFH